MEMQESTLFVGEFHRTIDEKGRLTIPANWRPKTGGTDISYLALPTPDGNISVYPPKMVAQLEARISQVSIGDIEGQKAITELMSMAHSFTCDKQGRINLNDRLVGHAKIQKDVVLIACQSVGEVVRSFKRLVVRTNHEGIATAQNSGHTLGSGA